MGFEKVSEGAEPEHLDAEHDAHVAATLKTLRAEIAALLPPAKRRADLDEAIRKKELYLKGQNEQIDKLESEAKGEVA